MWRTSSVVAAALLWSSLAWAQTSATNPNSDALPSRPLLTPSSSRCVRSPHSLTSADAALQQTAAAPRRAEIGPTALNEELSNFDDRLADLHWQDGRWQLWVGPQLLKDFGRRETEGRFALTVIRQLHLNQRGTVGSPRPIMEYWLSDGRVPTDTVPGLRTMPIDRASLRTESVQGYWCVRDARNTFFNFGGHEDEAERALAIMRHYGFDRMGLIGQSTPTMLIFFGMPSSVTAASSLSPVSKSRTSEPRPLGTGQNNEPVGDVAPSMLQPSRMTPSSSLPLSARPGTTDARNRPNTAPGSDLAAAAMSFGRQLAPPSARSLDLAALAERVPLDARQARLSRDQQGWKLFCGNYVVADFGPSEREAKLAEMAFRTSRFTEQCVIGHPTPAFSYFLVNGQPPRGLPLGAPSITFRADDLTVRQVNGAWTISDLTRPLFVFGDKAEEAKQALKAIQRYQFDACCRLGQGEQGMTILARTR
jgi:hypothetical protein